ncbi:MAG: TfoX/Sxy family DNA transformation protein [Pseudobdellovibrionaceae bacterium]|jgi:hypothetical protein
MKKTSRMMPQMFRDELPSVAFDQASSIKDLKNLGPKSEMEFSRAGIRTPQMFMKLGWKKTLVKLVAQNPKNLHSVFAYALIGALENKDWLAISENAKKEAREFCSDLRKKQPTKSRKK